MNKSKLEASCEDFQTFPSLNPITEVLTGELSLLLLRSHKAILEDSLTLPHDYGDLLIYHLLTCLWTQRHNSPPLLPVHLHRASHHSSGRGYYTPGSFLFWRKRHMNSIWTSNPSDHLQQLQEVKEIPSFGRSVPYIVFLLTPLLRGIVVNSQ